MRVDWLPFDAYSHFKLNVISIINRHILRKNIRINTVNPTDHLSYFSFTCNIEFSVLVF